MGKVVFQKEKLGLTNKTEAHNRVKRKKLTFRVLFISSIILNIYLLLRN